MLTDQTLSCSK